MATKETIIVDTDILIKVYRGDVTKRQQLERLKGRVAITIVTVLELMQGVNTKKKLFDFTVNLRHFRLYTLMFTCQSCPSNYLKNIPLFTE